MTPETPYQQGFSKVVAQPPALPWRGFLQPTTVSRSGADEEYKTHDTRWRSAPTEFTSYAR
eukprot:3523285-Pyramimonas_sp.AAC.2